MLRVPRQFVDQVPVAGVQGAQFRACAILGSGHDPPHPRGGSRRHQRSPRGPADLAQAMIAAVLTGCLLSSCTSCGGAHLSKSMRTSPRRSRWRRTAGRDNRLAPVHRHAGRTRSGQLHEQHAEISMSLGIGRSFFAFPLRSHIFGVPVVRLRACKPLKTSALRAIHHASDQALLAAREDHRPQPRGRCRSVGLAVIGTGK